MQSLKVTFCSKKNVASTLQKRKEQIKRKKQTKQTWKKQKKQNKSKTNNTKEEKNKQNKTRKNQTKQNKKKTNETKQEKSKIKQNKNWLSSNVFRTNFVALHRKNAIQNFPDAKAHKSSDSSALAIETVFRSFQPLRMQHN